MGNGREILIGLIGLTGAGKTTFASRASGRQDLHIGHGADSCTQYPYTVTFRLDGHRVTLIDTPGLDDSARPDVDILESIAKYLADSYGQGRLLDGLVFLHPITIGRVTGSENMRTRVIKAILGEDAFKRVAIATTMWDAFRADAAATKRVQHEERQAGIWRAMCERGATVFKHYDTRESALGIIRHLSRFAEPAALKLQVELERDNRLHMTTAGREVESQLREQIELLEIQLAAIRLQNYQDELDDEDEEIKDMEKEIDVLTARRAKLRGTVVRVKTFLAAIFTRRPRGKVRARR
ncbi:P-loop containing nucleoside triphosphate hydrolase protein [Lasiosphaeria ovina]|uniref:P-loop containing nucleoside triphosphate hydrolase protein n=1 Tax=Lasiosphaeria ovina TaxID=92902 RepID=A0AAE0JY75_9PEZI|nr:P-loop containing nucleoside triphosphate hydrolase protein [Lasiosphaeria ovina]